METCAWGWTRVICSATGIAIAVSFLVWIWSVYTTGEKYKDTFFPPSQDYYTFNNASKVDDEDADNPSTSMFFITSFFRWKSLITGQFDDANGIFVIMIIITFVFSLCLLWCLVSCCFVAKPEFSRLGFLNCCWCISPEIVSRSHLEYPFHMLFTWKDDDYSSTRSDFSSKLSSQPSSYSVVASIKKQHCPPLLMKDNVV